MNETVPVKGMESVKTVPVFGRWRAAVCNNEPAAIFCMVEDKWELRFFGTSGQRDKFVAEANRRLDVKV